MTPVLTPGCTCVGLSVDPCADPVGDPVAVPVQVFLREAERQHLQSLLHQEVLRRIAALQRRFRARLERASFLRTREASVCIQVPCP